MSIRMPAKCHMPAEWAPHECVWIGFPSFAAHWGQPLGDAQRQMAAFANAVHDNGLGETVHLIAGNNDAAFVASEMVVPGVHVEQRHIGDIWLRDTGCIIVHTTNGRIARNFGFNGWGGRYHFDGDQTIGAELALSAGIEVSECDWILEGGSIDVDGKGMAVTTRDCLSNPNRNPNLSQRDIETRLARDLGIERTLWLGDGLANDHTDGHIDNLARFVAPNHLVMPQARDADDPNSHVYADAFARAEAFGCKITALPSVGRFVENGLAVPASYMNFYIGNSVVVMPIYDSKYDDEALCILAELFPDRRIVGLPADAVLSGGGSFHCSSQQVPVC
jgi:agmatine deiminase